MSAGEFIGRTALVTGGARGIGRAVCQMLASEGAQVAVNFERNQAAAEKTVELLKTKGARAIAVKADVSQEDQVKEMLDKVRAELGPIDFLVNNAGIAESRLHKELTFAIWKRMFAVNVDGPFLTTWGVKDEMIARNFGRIVNIASIAAVLLKPDMIHYATTKAALVSFTRNCSAALAPHNIRVNCVAPGMTDTDITQAADPTVVSRLLATTPLGRMASPAEIAKAVRFFLSEDSSFVTGQTLIACGGRC